MRGRAARVRNYALMRMWLALVPLVVVSAGCETLREMKAALRGEEIEGDDTLGNARLRVEVEPPDGITILLDGVRVANVSPYVNDHAVAGSHLLDVRAMGFHPFMLSIELMDDEQLVVPVALRKRPRGSKSEPPPPPGPTRPPPPPPRSHAPVVPPGVKPIELIVVVRPPTAVSLDGVAVTGRELTLRRVHGQIGFHGIELGYRIGGAGLLFFTLPEDGATWQKGGKPKRPGSQFKHNRGVVQLVRVGSEGQTVTVLLKR